MISLGCGRTSAAGPAPAATAAAAPVSTASARAPAPREACLGLADRGIFADLDDKLQLALPIDLAAERVTARVDTRHALLVLSIDGFPHKAYPLGGGAALDVGHVHLQLRPGDRDELRPLLAESHTTEGPAAHDRDGDGIPDPLDVLIGAKKTVLNADAYTAEAEGYIAMKYPAATCRGRWACAPT